MSQQRIGVRLESLGLPFRRALAELGQLGVGGVQIDATGSLAPKNLSQTGRRQVLHLLRSHGLQLTALGCPLRRGLDTPEDQEPRLEHVRQVMTLSYELGCRVVIVQAGMIPESEEDPRARWLRDALLGLGQHGDRVGATLALETGLEPGDRLRSFLDGLDTGGLGVNMDPANLLMYQRDPYEAIRALTRRIVHFHARDARQASASRTAQEVPLGHGDIDWMQMLAVLEEVDYRGWLTIERESGESRLADIAGGVAFLRRFLN